MLDCFGWPFARVTAVIVLIASMAGCARNAIIPPGSIEPVITGFSNNTALVKGPIRSIAGSAILEESDVLVISSPGGRVAEAYAMIAVMKRQGTILVIPEKANCHSACLLLMAAAENVYVARDAQFTLHAASRFGQYHARATAMIRGYLRAHGWPDDMINKGVQDGAELSFDGVEAVKRGLAQGYACGETSKPTAIKICGTENI